jgi:hypothetical protein
MLQALAAEETDAVQLAAVGDVRLHASEQELRDPLRGHTHAVRRELLSLRLERLEVVDRRIAGVQKEAANSMHFQEKAIARLCGCQGGNEALLSSCCIRAAAQDTPGPVARRLRPLLECPGAQRASQPSAQCKGRQESHDLHLASGGNERADSYGNAVRHKSACHSHTLRPFYPV